MKESDVVSTVRGFLEAHGWRSVRMQRTVMLGQFQSGEPGIPDYLFLHYERPAVLWIEFKATGRKAEHSCLAPSRARGKRCTACDQASWKTRETARGGVAWTVDDFECFEMQYHAVFGGAELASPRLGKQITGVRSK